MAAIPIALANKIIKNVFNSEEPISKGSVELLAEIIGQSVLTTLLLYLVNKVIVAIPTYTTEPMKEINITTMGVVITFALFAFNNNKITDKFNILYNRVQKMWGGGNEQSEDNKRDGKNKNKISVSKPISSLRTASPTHQESRADYVATQQQMGNPSPPINQMGGNTQQIDNDNNNGGGSSVGMDFPTFSEPAAFNSGGGFSSW